MTIFEALRSDHDIQRMLTAQLIETQGDSGVRSWLFEQIKTELKAHAAAEERCFYVPLLAHDRTQEKSRHSIAEHHKLDALLAQLETTDLSSPGWISLAKELHHLVHHHLAEEEHEVFQAGGEVLGEDEKQALAVEYHTEMASQKRQC